MDITEYLLTSTEFKSMEQSEFLTETKKIYDKIFYAFDEIDPDIAEADINLDNISITFSDGVKYIINRQPSVQQIWLATKTRGLHFNFEQKSKKWLCDKTQDELLELLSTSISKRINQTIKLN